jgi:Sigma-70 region 2
MPGWRGERGADRPGMGRRRRGVRQLAGPHRRELQVHCYRILGSVADAEDLLQQILLAAWRGLATEDEWDREADRHHDGDRQAMAPADRGRLRPCPRSCGPLGAGIGSLIGCSPSRPRSPAHKAYEEGRALGIGQVHAEFRARSQRRRLAPLTLAAQAYAHNLRQAA